MRDTRVALVQDSPVLFELDLTMQKVDQLMQKAGESSPDLVVFPEAFVAGYPRGLTFGSVIGSRTDAGRALYQRYYDHSIAVGDQGFQQLSLIVKKHKCYVAIGVIEKSGSGSLYCAIFYFDPKGQLIGKHRKLKPTAAERVVWAEGAGDDLDVYDLPFGKTGGLICWENYMPLARTWLYQQEIEIYIAPTADARDSWIPTLQHIAMEGRCYVLSCNQFVTKSDYPNNLPGESIDELPEILSRGGSCIVSPLGEILTPPLYDQAGIIHLELSAAALTQSKLDFDAVGHYSRDDVFALKHLKS
ncbi:MAG: nitrilase [Cyclobacteriaceae bacterium]|jgi:nitrilase